MRAVPFAILLTLLGCPGSDGTDTDPGADTDSNDTDDTDEGTPLAAGISEYTGPSLILYGYGNFYDGGLVTFDPQTGAERSSFATTGSTVGACTGPNLVALVSGLRTSAVVVLDADGTTERSTQSWDDLRIPYAAARWGDELVTGDHVDGALSVWGADGSLARTLDLESIADRDRLAEPSWLYPLEDDTLWVLVERYDQFLGGDPTQEAASVALAVIEPGQDEVSELWDLGSDLAGRYPVVHEGRVYVSDGGEVQTDGTRVSGGVEVFDLASRRVLDPLVSDINALGLAPRADGSGLWLTYADPAKPGQYWVATLDWNGALGTPIELPEVAGTVAEDDAGQLWLGGDGGLKRLDPGDGSVVTVRTDEGAGSVRYCGTRNR